MKNIPEWVWGYVFGAIVYSIMDYVIPTRTDLGLIIQVIAIPAILIPVFWLVGRFDR